MYIYTHIYMYVCTYGRDRRFPNGEQVNVHDESKHVHFAAAKR